MITSRAAPAALLLAIALAAAACGNSNPNPPSAVPNGSGAPAPSGAPGPSGAPTASGAPADGGLQFPLRGDHASALWGIYTTAAMRVDAAEYAASLQASMSCDELLQVLAAGEWTVSADVPLAPPASALPSGAVAFAGHWVLLERGDQAMFGQLGGDDDSCGGKLVRSTRQPVTASGAYSAQGDARVVQFGCMAGAGTAEPTLLYFGPGDLRVTLGLEVPLRLGTTEVGDFDATITRSSVSLASLFAEYEKVMRGGTPDTSLLDDGEELTASESFRGELTVTSVDPLVGEVRLEGMTTEEGRAQSVTAGFRCDLPPGRLAAAAAAAPSPTPTPSPTPASDPDALRLVLTGGKHPGTYDGSDGELTCTYGLMQDGEWLISWSPRDEAGPDGLALVQVAFAAPRKGGTSAEPDLSIVIGDSGDLDSFLAIGKTITGARTGSGKVTATPKGTGTHIELDGKTHEGTRVALEIDCGRVDSLGG